ncbi:MAG: hypothetical protein Kow0075_01750 [Salibacteraceae bacterium]
MKLFKWPKNLKPKFPKIIERFTGKSIHDEVSESENVALLPSVNIHRKGDNYQLSVALPGFDKSDVEIKVENDVLVIRSEKEVEDEENKDGWLRREYSYASFQRLFQLPEDADPESVSAEMKNGVLKVKIGTKKGKLKGKRTISVG